MPNFGLSERHIKELFASGVKFTFNEKEYTVEKCGKPTCQKGEPKTDIYVLASYENGEKEFKISFKQTNADFIENKTNAERARLILGEDWKSIVIEATKSIADKFAQKPLIYKVNHKHTGNGAITLGWKYELLNKSGGDLSGVVNLTKKQIVDVYAGTNLPADKKNASVNGEIIENSGIANYILMDDSINTAQDVVDKIIDIDAYVDMHPIVYFACKALNYRSFEGKYDGNRPLSVYVDWSVENGKLKSELVFDAPLVTKGDEVAEKLLDCLNELSINNTDEIDDSIVVNPKIIVK